MLWPAKVAAGHPRVIAAVAVGLLFYALLPDDLQARAVLAWDIGAVSLLALAALMFVNEGDDARIAHNAARQEEGEWTMFGVTLAGVVFSFVALTTVLAGAKDLPPAERNLRFALVGATLIISWLVTHVLFALRYAHEYYARSTGSAEVDGGLQFPGGAPPDYWDFVYFALVLGMTFQVSDVQITSRQLRRLATAHGLIGFLFNTVIVALTVNIAAGLL